MKTTTSIAALLMTSALLSCAKPAADKTPTAAFDAATEKAAIMASYQKGCQGFSDGDIEAAMSPYSRDLFLYDFAPPYKSDYEHLKQANIALRENMATNPSCTYEEMVIEIVTADFAYSHYILPFSATMKNGMELSIHGRGTDVFRKIDGQWKIVHEHFSVPADPITGKAELQPPK